MTTVISPEPQTKNPNKLRDELVELGFNTAARGVDRKIEVARKMAIAFEHHKVVTQDNVDQFNKKLKRRSFRSFKSGYRRRTEYWQHLKFTDIAYYEEIPPQFVLNKLKEAKERNCFDAFVVATIGHTESERKFRVRDPILFGMINGCSNRYFIAQWDDDLKIEDLLGKDEG